MFKKIRDTFLPVLSNKYLLSVSIFFIWLLFFDNNNLIVRKRLMKEERQLRKDCVYYQQRIVADSTHLTELRKDMESLEKFAREQYLMKKENEDIFVIVKK